MSSSIFLWKIQSSWRNYLYLSWFRKPTFSCYWRLLTRRNVLYTFFLTNALHCCMAVLLQLWGTKRSGSWISCRSIHQTRCPSSTSAVCLACTMTGASLSALTQERMTFCTRTTCSQSSERGLYFLLFTLFYPSGISTSETQKFKPTDATGSARKHQQFSCIEFWYVHVACLHAFMLLATKPVAFAFSVLDTKTLCCLFTDANWLQFSPRSTVYWGHRASWSWGTPRTR